MVLKKNIIWKVILLGLLPLLIISGGVITIIVAYFVIFSNGSVEKRKPTEVKLTKLDPLQNQTSYGFARTSKTLGDEEYLTYSQDGVTFVLSNFENTQYECTGSCYCEEEAESYRRGGLGFLSVGLFVVLSAISPVQAKGIAEESFQNSCQEKYTNACDEDNIRSEVQNCEEVEMDMSTLEDGTETTPTPTPKLYTYACSGQCMINEYIFLGSQVADLVIEELGGDRISKSAREEYFTKFGICQDLDLKMQINVVADDIGEIEGEKDPSKIAVFKFVKNHLILYCGENSMVESPEFVYNKKNDEPILEKSEHELFTKEDSFGHITQFMEEGVVFNGRLEPLCAPMSITNKNFDNINCMIIAQE